MMNLLKLTLITILLGASAIFYAASSEKSEKGKVVQKYATIFDAIQASDANAVRQFIKEGADVNMQNKEGQTPLIKAIGVNLPSPEIVDILLVAHADPNSPIKDWGSPLCIAYRRMTIDRMMSNKRTFEAVKMIVRSLLDAGGTCFNAEDFLDDDLLAIIAEIKTQAQRETKAAQEIFKASLPRAITEGPIAEYLGVPVSEQRQERERQERERIIAEEKEKAAAAAAQAARARAQARSAGETNVEVESLD
jgi:hypothetical protein